MYLNVIKNLSGRNSWCPSRQDKSWIILLWLSPHDFACQWKDLFGEMVKLWSTVKKISLFCRLSSWGRPHHSVGLYHSYCLADWFLVCFCIKSGYGKERYELRLHTRPGIWAAFTWCYGWCHTPARQSCSSLCPHSCAGKLYNGIAKGVLGAFAHCDILPRDWHPDVCIKVTRALRANWRES